MRPIFVLTLLCAVVAGAAVIFKVFYLEKRLPRAESGSFVVVNVQDVGSHKDCHIKGSVNVPLDILEEYAKDLDKSTPVVFYCSNYACTASGVARDMLVKKGFSDVAVYEGGLAEWYQKGYPVEGRCRSSYLAGDAMKQELIGPHEAGEGAITAEQLKDKLQRFVYGPTKN